MATFDDNVPSSISIARDEPELDAPLREYRRAKQAVADVMRQIRDLLDRSAPWMGERLQTLMIRLGEDRFNLVVVGQFKRGKSSLMNAVMQDSLLPTGTIPVTSAITSVRHGPHVRAVITRADFAIAQEIPVADLPQFITERGNPGNRKHVISAELEVPAPFLRRGLYFIDTPGIGSAHEHNTATTLGFLPQADAAIFVTAADGPMSETELQFLDAVRQHVRKLFFVLNKIDTMTAGDRDEAVAYTAALLEQRLGRAVRVFPISAQRALDAGTDAGALIARGMPALESALAHFLNEERRDVFLVAMVDRLDAVLDEARFTLRLRERATAPEEADRDARRRDLGLRLEVAEQARVETIERVDAALADWHTAVFAPALARFSTAARDALSVSLLAFADGMSDAVREDAARADDRLRAEVKARAEEWLAQIAGDIDDAVTEATDRGRAAARGLVNTLRSDVASIFVLNDAREQPSAPEPEDQREWLAPVFTPAARDVPVPPAPESLARISGPRFLARRLADRWLAERAAEYVASAEVTLRDAVLDHLRLCVRELDAWSLRFLMDARRRLELPAGMNPRDQQPLVPASEALRDLDRAAEAVSRLRAALLGGEPVGVEPILSDAAMPAPAPDRAEKPGPERIAATGTCPICAVACDAVFDFFCHYQYAVTHDPAVRRAFLASRGLCALHTWQLEHISSARGTSLAYPPLLDAIEERLRGLTRLGAATGAVRMRELTQHPACPACLARKRAEQRAAEQIVLALTTRAGFEQFDRQQWLCFTHVPLVLSGVDDSTANMLARLLARRAGELAESMREFVIKHDALRRGLISKEEESAYRMVLVLLSGERYLATDASDD